VTTSEKYYRPHHTRNVMYYNFNAKIDANYVKAEAHGLLGAGNACTRELVSFEIRFEDKDSVRRDGSELRREGIGMDSIHTKIIINVII